MDWNSFFERTRDAAQVDSYAKLAPLIGVTDGAIGHYRQGRRVPQAWVVAACLRVQGHPHPEKGAAEILKTAAATSDERRFWRHLATAAAFALCAIALPYLFDSQGTDVASLSLMFAVLAIGAIAGTVLEQPGRSPIGGSYA